jgi:hypothetical protein
MTTVGLHAADKEPANPRTRQDLFWVEAAKYNMLPIGERFDT